MLRLYTNNKLPYAGDVVLKRGNVGDDLGIKSVQAGGAMGTIAEGLIGFVDNFEPKDFFAKVALVEGV
jgi:hypothetical protein